MKKGIHPEYFEKAKIICACGAVFEVGATEKEMRIEICSQCHPFYTGKKKVVDTMGRVDRFNKLSEKAASKKLAIKSAKEKKKAVAEKIPAKKKVGKK